MLNSYLFGFDSDHRATPPITNTSPTGAFPSGRSDASDVRYLEERVDRLSLICMAMWSLLQDQTSLTEDDLLQRVKALDLMDGDEDGKATRTVMKCVKCGRPMSARHKRCLYCGHEKLVESAFDTL